MKKYMIKSSLLAGLLALLFAMPDFKSGSLTDITKPYLGEYECKKIVFDGEDHSDWFSDVRLELKPDKTFVLTYPQNGKKHETKGRYVYDEQSETITLSAEGAETFKRRFPLKDGMIYITLTFGEKTLSMQFEQK